MVSWLANLSCLLHAVFRFSKFFTSKLSCNGRQGKESEDTRTKLGQACLFSRLTFTWVSPLISLGHSKPLTVQDIPELLQEDEALVQYDRFSCVWNSLGQEIDPRNGKNLLLRALVRTQWQEMMFVGVCALLRTVAVVAAPLLVYAFVKYTSNEHRHLRQGLTLVGSLAAIKFIESLSQRHWYFSSRRSGLRVRSAVLMAIYNKLLQLSNQGRRSHSSGEIMNYIAVDAYRMGDMHWWFQMLWSLVLQLFLAIGVLYHVVGLGALPGLLPILVVGFLNVPLARKLKKYQSQFMVAQDERLKTTMEVLSNMKIIKLQSWEHKFKDMISSLRANEYKYLAKVHKELPYATLLYWMSPTIASAAVFFGCVLTSSAPLNAATVFTVLATLRSMSEPMAWIPRALSMLIQVKISLDRLNKFLLDDEMCKEETDIPSENFEQKPENTIEIRGGSYSWEPESAVLALRDVNLEVKKGQKVAVCGAVGSGKSSLLYAILKEIPKIEGLVNVYGSIAYVPQAPWIQSGTVRDNILCGSPMEKSRYDKVIQVCALGRDICSFNHGDLTEIGERGLNLSGGQKQRIQIARAVYKDADIYLLDDPFSAVDAETAAVLFNECVMAALKVKTVILVTHQIEFLPEVDKILVMQEGKILQSGSYEELRAAGAEFEQLVSAHQGAMQELPSLDYQNKCEISVTHANQYEEPHKRFLSEENTARDISIHGQLTKEEEIETGSGGLKQIMYYLQVSKGFLLFSLAIICQLAFSATQAGASYWLALASRAPKISSGLLVGVYTGISISSAPLVFFRSLFGALVGLKASKAFFSGINESLFKAPMLFFDSTPVGRIYTRVSSDMNTLDNSLSSSIIYSAISVVDLSITIVVMASVTWPVLFIAIPAITAAIFVQRYYLSTARELIRISGTTKAPILSLAAETSQGLVVIRAFDMTGMFFKKYTKLIDTDGKLFFHDNAAMEWLILRVETLQNLILLTAAFLIVLLPWKHLPGLAGLSLSYALTLNTVQVVMSKCHCDLSNDIISAERIKQFIHIPPECSDDIAENMRPPPSWPSCGRIELQDLQIRYRPNFPLILKGITCTLTEGTRIGVVGRTGSGKTTLINALFRLVEPESGRIIVDGLDICSIGLKDLRTKLSIIPQEPTLFRGNIRSNLDPLGVHSDEEIWKIIDKCQLKAAVSNLPQLLESSVNLGGENWSIGQRQLLCLGRVLLRRNRILVLDEATASIDTVTDAILQRIIREEFAGCTVITIAHRVPSVIDSDMIMVLSNGELVEYDVPSNLMKTNSSFARLVAEYWSNCRKKTSLVAL